jgi:aminoglycoside phosphotransferase family enzyme/predicted kinase
VTAVVETHVSVVFFLEDVVLKLKKPVRFPFVDFTTMEARRAACEEEVRVNRRLAPDVYLGVAQTTLGERVIDHGVVMRRLPAERSVAAMVGAGAPRFEEGLEALASVLAAFHDRAERSAEIDEAGDVDSVGSAWDSVIAGLAPFAGGVIERRGLEEADRLARRFLSGRRPLFAERVARRRVCDGHGDLLASDVFLLDDGPRVLDAIDFDRRLRHGDVIADVAFLAMDLERLGAPEAAQHFLAVYQSDAGDVFPVPLVHYYVAARATVRALVACLRGAQRLVPVGDGVAAADGVGRPESVEAQVLMDCALGHLRSVRVVLGVVSGLPGTGKSTTAAAAGAALGWPVLRSDEIRRELVDPPTVGPLVAPLRRGPYDAEQTGRVYETLFERARVLLERGQSVILDATFGDGRFQHAAQRLAENTASDLVVVETVAPLEVAADRARERRRRGGDVSGADDEVVRDLAAAAHPWPLAVAVDTVSSDPNGAALEAVRVLCAEASPPRRCEPGTPTRRS